MTSRRRFITATASMVAASAPSVRAGAALTSVVEAAFTGVTAAAVRRVQAAAPSTRPAALVVRLRWPWDVHFPNPFAANDLVAALLGASLFPPLYARAADGYLEPRAAAAAPKEARTGLRVDLAPSIRPSDVVASIINARSGGARLALRDLPVPRVDGAHGVVFPGLSDVDALMRKLATPLAGIARMEPRRVSPAGAFDCALADRDNPRILRVRARPLPGGVALESPTGARRLAGFDLEQGDEIGTCLRAFELGQTEIGWLADGFFSQRAGARAIDLGPLAFLGLRAGGGAPDLARPGGALSLVDAIAPDRLAHLGLLKRGPVVAPTPRSGVAVPLPLGRQVVLLSRAAAPLAAAASEIIARELGCTASPLDDASFERALADRHFGLALDVVRAIDDSTDGAAIALASFDGATSAPPAGTGARGLASSGTAALGWEIALLGAEASHVWIPRAPHGGLDLDVGSAGV